MNPKISVITTVYNCEDYIAQSVKSILNQTFRDFEYIIVNDGSKDNTLAIVSKLAEEDDRIRVFDNGVNLGRVVSLNKALNNSTGEYIALQDADDISFPQRLEKQFKFLDENSDYVLAGANIIVIDEFENFISRPNRPIENSDAKFSLLFRCTFANPSIIFRKKVLTENNIRYEDNFNHAEDYRIITHISKFGKVYNIEQPLIKYRKHGSNNSTVNQDIVKSGTVQIVKENLTKMGFKVNEEQVIRIRDLISSRGINSEYIYEDISLIFKTIKLFREKNNTGKNNEILLTIRRMMKWLGKKNILTKPEFLKLYISLKIYYIKESLMSGN